MRSLGLPWLMMMLGLVLSPFLAQPARADVIINAPVIIRQDDLEEPEELVVVDFVAPGQEWANVSLNGERVYAARNFNRRQRLELEPGAYYLEITGVNRFEIWARGYLDVGLNDANVMVVTFSRQRGVRVSGDPYGWIPDDQSTSIPLPR
jgi:hypothetical protein